MEREAIERLTIDSAAGELNEDADALLKTYLTEHPEAKQWSKETLSVYNTAASVINAKTRKTPGIPPVRAAKKTSALSILNWQTIARWAAVLILASTAGIGIGRWSKETKFYTNSSVEEEELHSPIKGLTFNIRNDDSDFWHRKVVAFLEPSTYPQQKPLLRNSNWQEQYYKLKEKRHE